MLTGRLPFEAEDNIALAHMHMHDEPPPLHVLNPQVSLQLAQIVNKVLSKEPAARYRTADQLGRILAGYLQGAEQATGYQPLPAAVSSEPLAPPRESTPPPRERQPTPPPRERPHQAGPASSTDWQLWFVGAVAVLAVLGLVPLWALVYRTYTSLGQVTSTPVVTPVITQVSNTTIVPQLRGLGLEVAREEAARANLGVVIEEREDPAYPVPTVLEQEPAAGQEVSITSQVRLVVSKPLVSSDIPDVVGYVLSNELREGLQSRGWSVATEEAWSSEPEGQILSVQPPVGTNLAAGNPVTLTISAGTSRPIPMEVNLNNTIMLDSVVLPDDRYQPGEIVSVVLRWRALQPVSNSYTVFVHLIGPGGATVAQEDREPRMGDRSMPTSSWTPGVIVTDSHLVSVPPDAVSGTYQLRTGMYLPSNGQRLPVLDAGQTTAVDNSILIKEIQVGP
jgi:serine/threonine-protein kinase